MWINWDLSTFASRSAVCSNFNLKPVGAIHESSAPLIYIDFTGDS